ncbi:MAG: hypothetical protein ACRC4M_01150 [Mycoplasma sp.]
MKKQEPKQKLTPDQWRLQQLKYDTLAKIQPWDIIWVKEKDCNYYKGVDEEKLRPLMVWSIPEDVDNAVIAFYCTTKKAPRKKNYQIKIRKLEQATWSMVDLTKMLFIPKEIIVWEMCNKYSVDKSINKKKIKDGLKKLFSI